MANKREFKKYVEAVGANACEAMMTTYYNCDGVDKATVEKAIGQVLGAVGAARANANIFFDKGAKAFDNREDYSKAKHAFFKKMFAKIVDDFNAQLDAAIKTFNSAIPEKVKEENKAAAAAE